MVKVKLKQRDPKNLSSWIEVELYFDGYIKANLDEGLKQLKNDFDMVFFIDGGEGSGKSDLVSQLAYYVNPPETRHTLIDRICLTPEEFDKAILKAERYEAVVLDEAYGGMASSGVMSKINKVLQRRFSEIRAKNLFVFILAPSFMDIMRYFAIWRSKCLLHVYLSKDKKRGFCAFYGEQRKRKLYILGKKAFYNYSVVPPQFVFRFIKQQHKVIDRQEYNKRKFRVMGGDFTQEEQEKREDKKKNYAMLILSNMKKEGVTLDTLTLSRIFGYERRNIQYLLKEIGESKAIADN